MAFPYKHVLMVGATSGIGKEMASKLIGEGCKVTAVGRRIDRLEAFVREHGEEMATAIPFDIGDLAAAPQFAKQILAKYPGVDCVFLNAGVQARYDFSKPQTVNLNEFNEEMKVNFSSFVALTHAFLPHLMNTESSSLIYTGSNLAIVPAAPIPAYSASKAALNSFVLCLRDQLRVTNVKIIELSPPPVQTELHDKEMGQEAGRKLGMPVDQFVNLAYEGIVRGEDQIVVGSIGPAQAFNQLIDTRRATFESLARMMRGERD